MEKTNSSTRFGKPVSAQLEILKRMVSQPKAILGVVILTLFIMMAIFALLPFGGTALVWLPAGIIMLSLQNWFAGIGILVWGVFIVGLIDNILKPKLIGKKTNLHPLLVFVSIIGGLWAFGFIGVLIGPIIAALLIVLLDMYRVRFVE